MTKLPASAHYGKWHKPFRCPTGKLIDAPGSGVAAANHQIYGMVNRSGTDKSVCIRVTDAGYFTNLFDQKNGRTLKLTPSAMPLLGDSVLIGEVAGTDRIGNQTRKINSWVYNNLSHSFSIQAFCIRHSKQGNMVFFDAHVGQLRSEDTVKIQIYSVGDNSGTVIRYGKN